MSGGVRKATWLELFFDLVFVVAIAKAVHSLGHLHDGHIAGEAYFKYVLIMVPLWWAWTGHTLFADRFDVDDVPQRLMTLTQMACAASMSVFVSPDFDANYRGFLFSYAAFRGLLVLMYWRAAAISVEDGRRVAAFLGSGFTVGLLITLSSLSFGRPWNYVVLYVGIAFDMLVPLLGRRHLKRAPVDGHHLPERFALLTIILLGESVASLVSTVARAETSVAAVTAATAGFVLTAAIWWTYYENLEDRIYGRALGTGQAVIYLHLAIYVSLGGVANAIRFAIEPSLALADYKALSGGSAVCFLTSMQLLHLAYHPRRERGALLRDAGIVFVLVATALVFAQTNLTVMLAITSIFVVHAGSDALRRRAHRRHADGSPPPATRAMW